MAANISQVIIYSHGFGVRKTDRGLFTAITQGLPDVHHIMFDYNPVHEQSNTITVKPLQKQALKLRKVINEVRVDYPDAVIDLVCHSQGCVVAGLVKPRGIRKVIMLTPPAEINAAAMAESMSKRHDTDIDVTTRTRLLRSDGSTTVIHPDYWQSLTDIDPVKLYNKLARFTQLRIINAKQDDVLGSVNFEALHPSVSSVTLDGNHNFNEEESRKRLLYILQKELI